MRRALRLPCCANSNLFPDSGKRPGAGKGALPLNPAAFHGWLGPITLGQNEALQNSQCLLDGAISSAVQTGTDLQLNLGLFFDRSFVGSKSIFMEVNDGKQDSGWSKRSSLEVEFFNLNF